MAGWRRPHNLLDEIHCFTDHNLDTAPRGSKYHTEEVPDRPEYRFSRVVLYSSLSYNDTMMQHPLSYSGQYSSLCKQRRDLDSPPATHCHPLFARPACPPRCPHPVALPYYKHASMRKHADPCVSCRGLINHPPPLSHQSWLAHPLWQTHHLVHPRESRQCCHSAGTLACTHTNPQERGV